MKLNSQSDSNLKNKIISWLAHVPAFFALAGVSLFALDSTSAFSIPGMTRRPIQSGDSSPSTQEEIKQLILQMGDPDYSVRNDAEQQLLKIGERAIAPLRKTLTHKDGTGVPDSEIRLRAVRLVILIEREVHAKSIEDFVEGKSENIRFDGWDEFSSIVGDQKSSRQLFIKTHESRPEIFKAIAKGKDAVEYEIHQVISRRLRVSGSTNANTVIGSLSAVLFMASHDRQWNPNQPATFIRISDADTLKIRQALVRPQMLTSLNSHRSGKEVKLLIAKWLDTISSESPKSISNQIAVIDSYQFKNKSERCLAFAANKQIPAQMRASAIELVWRLSDEKPTKLEQLFSDATVVGTYLPIQIDRQNPTHQTNSRRLVEVQIRDLALAATILLDQKDIRNYGFHPSSFENEKLILNQAGFFNNQERERAFESWSIGKSKTDD